MVTFEGCEIFEDCGETFSRLGNFLLIKIRSDFYDLGDFLKGPGLFIDSNLRTVATLSKITVTF